MATINEGHLKVGTLEEVRRRPRTVNADGDRTIGVFYLDGEVYAVDNRCAHKGYPLDKGSMRNGVLNCLWHGARFDVASGKSLDSAVADIDTFPVTIVDGEVWVNPVPCPKSEAANRPS